MQIKIRLQAVMPLLSLAMLIASCTSRQANESPGGISNLKIDDKFWSPKFALWSTTTINDVFDKFEGKYNQDVSPALKQDFESLGTTRNAFSNFDLVAQGKRGIGKHSGPPWYDGLIYESIRGAADLLARYPDPKLEARIDDYIERIAAAQDNGRDGYLNTYTQLMEPDHRFGFNGGMLRWQHDVYNAGMLLEAGVHYYKATGKTKLLTVAVKFANYLYDYMGPSPKKNVVPAHSGPEEAAIKLYWLFKNEPELKKKIPVPVNEEHYYELATFWLENRGHHAGYPQWLAWGTDSAERWVRERKYEDKQYGASGRPTWGDYAQDSIPIFQQTTIEGHAVRATLLATGIATAAIENHDPKYASTATTLWNNMAGHRMFVTGGVGAIANDEKFGSDYYLPNDAYLETCAAVGAGFFSQRMNQLTGNGEYMDEFERVLYNNVLAGISAGGDHYTYVNPLSSDHQHRWEWHDCPCCPPMFLKMVGAMPDFIYLYRNDSLYVNLFVGNEATLTHHNKKIGLKTTTRYPWEGRVVLQLSPESETDIPIKIRIPGWALGQENPFGLYRSHSAAAVQLEVNGQAVEATPVNGYVTIDRKWKKGDEIVLDLPMKPRAIYANTRVAILQGQVAIASGPLIYGLEGNNNADLRKLKIDTDSPFNMVFNPALLGGINVITGGAVNEKAEPVKFQAIPYYAIGNLKPEDSYDVWINTR
jgi:DUF1680 family protein